jgi:hypothetical protein
MNKHAVALAADSAVTISSYNGRKVLNSANKIFNVSKYEPVGLMVYDSASFMGTPWDLIVKLFRKELGKTKYKHLSEYVDAFLQFLRERNFLCSEDNQKNVLLSMMRDFYNEISSDVSNELQRINNVDNIPNFEILKKMMEVFDTIINQSEKLPYCDDFVGYSLECFNNFAVYALDDIKKRFAKAGLVVPDGFIELYSKAFYTIICKQKELPNSTGIVFAGYGDDEIYPSLIPLNVLCAFDGKLRVFVNNDRKCAVTEFNKSAICPFAQTDVMMNILTGIATPIKELVYISFSKIISKYNALIIQLLSARGCNRDILNAINNAPLPAARDEFIKNIESYIQEEYIRKLMDTVEYLDIEDLSNMAESLISLTSLKKRMTSSEENVGGPVDVAVISKIDGFIWMKRKHYFDKELNRQFFERYNME